MLADAPDQTDRRMPAPAPSYRPAPTYIQQQPVRYAPAQPQVYYVTRPSASKTESIMLGLLALVFAVIASIGGFALARDHAPTDTDVAAYGAMAEREGFYAGRTSGYSQGRTFGRQETGTIANLRSRNRAWRLHNKGYWRGLAQAKKWSNQAYASRSTGGRSYSSGSGYRPVYSGARRGYYGGGRVANAGYGGYYGGGNVMNSPQVQSALGQAQSIANATGRPVDVEIY
jgi:hypothetical protein